MMRDDDIRDFALTAGELKTVTDVDWIYTKHRIISKVYDLFGDLSDKYRDLVNTTPGLVPETSSVGPKIYKGENYQLLPYVMLDYPRHFSRTNTLAIRHLFWWGKQFSIHLVLGGAIRETLGQQVINSLLRNADTSWFVSQTNDPWDHRFDSPNYEPITNTHQLNSQTAYIKLGKPLPLTDWDAAPQFFITSFTSLLSIIQSAVAYAAKT